MTLNDQGVACRFINWLARKCAGTPPVKLPVDVPPDMREASHRYANEVMAVRSTLRSFEQSVDALDELLRQNGRAKEKL